jgi:LuxR family transcriptional regulator, quorum-sensing system regulator LasR
MPGMTFIERLSDLICCNTVEEWRELVFRLGRELGYEQTRLAILPDRYAPIEAEHAFQHSNYSSAWLNKYTTDKLHHVDPTFSHCLRKSIPLIWSPDIFSDRHQKEMYEEASGYGIKSGVTLPIHGARGELGIVCFVSDTRPDQHFHNDAHRNLPELSCFRDFILESSLKFMKLSSGAEKPISVTKRELECLKWSAAGKSSWEIGQILHCTEATINFHFGNIRRKFDTNSRQQAVIMAINIGLINPT